MSSLGPITIFNSTFSTTATQNPILETINNDVAKVDPKSVSITASHLDGIIAENNRRSTNLGYGFGVFVARLLGLRDHYICPREDEICYYPDIEESTYECMEESDEEENSDYDIDYDLIAFNAGFSLDDNEGKETLDSNKSENDHLLSTAIAHIADAENVNENLQKISKLISNPYSDQSNLKFLIEDIPDLNIPYDKYGNSLLHKAIQSENVHAIRILLSAGAQVNIVDKFKQTPLYLVLKKGSLSFRGTEIIDLLLEHGADPLLGDNKDVVPLIMSFSNERVFKTLKNHISKIPLDVHEIIFKSIERMLKAGTMSEQMIFLWQKLVQSGFPISRRCLGKTLLHFAVELDLFDVVAEFVNQHPSEINQEDETGNTALEYAIASNKTRIIRFLQASGANSVRPTVLVVTDCTYQGPMYKQTIAFLRENFNELSVCPDAIVEILPRFYSKVHEFLSNLPTGVNRAQALLDSGIPEIVSIKEYAKKLIEGVDGIWLTGSDINICTRLYQHNDNFKKENCDIMRDIFELAILRAQENAEYTPLIGVCKGQQIINVYNGGTLQDGGEFGPNPIDVTKKEGFFGSALVNEGQLVGHSGHHQSISQLGKDLEVVALSSDGLVKAIQSSSSSNPLMGTQFHPEIRAPLSLSPASVYNIFWNPTLLWKKSVSTPVLDRFSQAVHAAKDKECLNTEEENARELRFPAI